MQPITVRPEQYQRVLQRSAHDWTFSGPWSTDDLRFVPIESNRGRLAITLRDGQFRGAFPK